jgi:hypothetical protein
MTLNSRSTYPSTRSYVLKLHRDAIPRREQIVGRLENMTSGRHFDFNNVDELFAYLAEDMTSTDTQCEESL